MPPNTPQNRTIRRHKVEITQDPEAGAWTEMPNWRCQTCSVGAGQVLGSATFFTEYGEGSIPGDPGEISPVDLLLSFNNEALYYVRVMIRDVLDESWAPLWFGYVTHVNQIDEGQNGALGPGRGQQTISAVSIQGILSKSFAFRGAESLVSPDFIELSDLPPFNKISTGDAGLVPVGGTNIRVHRRNGAGSVWTHEAAARYIFQFNGFPPDRISIVNAAAGGWFNRRLPPNTDLSGMSLLDVMNFLANERQGLTWTVRWGTGGVFGDASGSLFDILVWPVGAEPFLFEPFNKDFTSDRFLADVSVTEDWTQVVEQVVVLGGKSIETLTINKDALERGWGDLDESAYIANIHSAQGQNVGRRFKLKDDWNWSQYARPDIGIANFIGPSGDRTYDPSRGIGASVLLKIQPSLSAFLNSRQDRAPAFACAKPQDTSSVAQFIPLTDISSSDAISGFGTMPLRITHSDGVSWLTLGSTNPRQRQLLYRLWKDANLDILFTVAMESPERMQTIVPLGEGDPLSKKTLVIERPDLERWIGLEGTVLPGSTGFITATATQVWKDPTQTMDQLAEVAYNHYSKPAYTVSWTERGSIAYENYPGMTLHEATLGDPLLGSKTVECDCLINQITYNLSSENYGTSYSAARITLDIEAVV